MYIQKAKIKNIRSIVDFEIDFENPAGWHVLIGDNGSGKSTIIRSLALALAGNQIPGLRENWTDWLNKSSSEGSILVDLAKDWEYDIYEVLKPYYFSGSSRVDFERVDDFSFENLQRRVSFRKKKDEGVEVEETSLFDGIERDEKFESLEEKDQELRIEYSGFFSAAYGPHRRFEGGNMEMSDLFKNPQFSQLAAHLSVFGEDVALTEAANWLVGLFNSSTDPNFPKEQLDSREQLANIEKLINWEEDNESFLPNNTKLESINSKGVFFKDGNGSIISVNELSDGYRSVLSMTFELIRQLLRVYKLKSVFKNIENGRMYIDVPGVVLIDEIDAHLHPTWQTRIGNWFLKYFPNLQFIVTTHSPLVCRAAEKGTIWRLAAPGSEEESKEVIGPDRDRLIYGTILDAYGTEVFGSDVSISEESVEKQKELVKLSKKEMLDHITPDEEKKLSHLKKVFTTDAPIEL